jgi:hypothetical protein
MERMRITTGAVAGVLALVLGACGADSSEDAPTVRGVPAAEAETTAIDDPVPGSGDPRLEDLVREGLLPADDVRGATGATVDRCRAQASELLPC